MFSINGVFIHEITAQMTYSSNDTLIEVTVTIADDFKTFFNVHGVVSG